MSDPFDEVMPGRRGSEHQSASARPPESCDGTDVDTGVLRMEFWSDISPLHVGDLWSMQIKLNDAAANDIRLTSDNVKDIVENHGFDARPLCRFHGEQTRVWELARGGEAVAFLYESDIVSEPFVTFPRADGVRFS